MSDIFDAVADPIRRQILESLAAKPKQSVSDLVALTKQGQPSVSKHLKTLREAGLVTVVTVGPNRFYSIVEKPLLEIAKWLGKVGVARLEQAANEKTGKKTTSKTSTNDDLSPVATLIGDLVAYGLDLAGKKIGERVTIEVDGKKLGKQVGRKLAEAKSGGEKAAKKAVDKGAKAAKDATEQAVAAAREAVENAAAEIRHRTRRKAD